MTPRSAGLHILVGEAVQTYLHEWILRDAVFKRSCLSAADVLLHFLREIFLSKTHELRIDARLLLLRRSDHNNPADMRIKDHFLTDPGAAAKHPVKLRSSQIHVMVIDNEIKVLLYFFCPECRKIMVVAVINKMHSGRIICFQQRPELLLGLLITEAIRTLNVGTVQYLDGLLCHIKALLFINAGKVHDNDFPLVVSFFCHVFRPSPLHNSLFLF